MLDINKIRNADLLLRGAGFFFFLCFFLSRLFTMSHYGNDYLKAVSPSTFHAYRILWFLESTVFLIYMSAYLFRRPAQRLATGFTEVIFPFFAAALPFLMIRYSFLAMFFPGIGGNYQDLTHLVWQGKPMYIVQVDISFIPLATALGFLLAGSLIMLGSLATLWKSFSIMVEARQLVTGGLYRFIRHPLYLGEIVAYMGVLIMRFSAINVLILVIFIVCQVIRAHLEEKKLESAFPEYAEYRKKTWMLMPGIY